jgi:hypothetical protein
VPKNPIEELELDVGFQTRELRVCAALPIPKMNQQQKHSTHQRHLEADA